MSMVLSEGEIAPNFEYMQEGELKEFYDVEGEKVVFFFPRAFTSSCTAEACSIQDSYDDLKQEGVSEVFGISMDSEEKQDKFRQKYNLEYILVDDTDGSISKAYGVYQRKFLLFKISARYTFIVDEDNVITKVFENGLRGEKSEFGMDQHGSEVLNFINN